MVTAGRRAIGGGHDGSPTREEEDQGVLSRLTPGRRRMLGVCSAALVGALARW